MARPAACQDRGVSLYARSGGFNAFTSLNDAGTDHFKKVGFTVGGGAQLRLNQFVSLRGDFTYARNELETSAGETDSKLERFFYDAVVRLQYPTTMGFEPYVFAGGGIVRLSQVDAGAPDVTKPAGTFGIGLSYAIPHTGLGLFVEGKGWVYDMNNAGGFLAGYDRRQAEMGWTVGVSYRIPL
jgi:opacity protein-like surface antigen